MYERRTFDMIVKIMKIILSFLKFKLNLICWGIITVQIILFALKSWFIFLKIIV